MATIGYFWTVLPIYRLQQLEEQYAQLQLKYESEQEKIQRIQAERAEKDRALADTSRALEEASRGVERLRKEATALDEKARTHYQNLRIVAVRSFAYQATVICIQQAAFEAASRIELNKADSAIFAGPPAPSVEEFVACVRKVLSTYEYVKYLRDDDQSRLRELVGTLPRLIAAVPSKHAGFEKIPASQLYGDLSGFGQSDGKTTPETEKARAEARMSITNLVRNVLVFRWQRTFSAALDALVKEFLS